MHYTLREKSGKHLGSFDLPTIIQMLKNSRLSGSEEFLSTIDQSWHNLDTIAELAPHLGPLMPLDPPNGMSLGGNSGGMSMQSSGAAFPDSSLEDSFWQSPAEASPKAPAPKPATPPPTATPAAKPPGLGAGDISLSLEETIMGESPLIETPVKKAAAPPPPAKVEIDFPSKPPPLSPSAGAPLSKSVSNSSGPLTHDSLIQHDPLEDLLTSPLPSAPVPPSSALPEISLELDSSATDVRQFPDPPPLSPSAPAKKSDDIEDLFSPADAQATAEVFKSSAKTSGGEHKNLFGGQEDDEANGASESLPEIAGDALSFPTQAKLNPLEDSPFSAPAAPAKSVSSSSASSSHLDALLSTPAGGMDDDQKVPAAAKILEKVAAAPILAKDKKSAAKTTTKKPARSAKLSGAKIKPLYLAMGFGVILLGAGTFYFKDRLFKNTSTSEPSKTSKVGAPETAAVEPVPQTFDGQIKRLLNRDNYGSYLEAVDKIEKAKSDPNGATKDKPEHYEALELEALARSQMYLAKPIPERLRQMDEFYNKISAPTTPESLRAVAAALFVKKNYEQAQQKLSDPALANEPDPAINELRGWIALNHKESAKAESLFNAALKDHPAYLPALYGLAQVAKLGGVQTDYETRLIKVLELQPAHVASRIELGTLYYKMGNSPEAEKNLVPITGAQSKEASGPQIATAQYTIGLILRDQGRPDEASKLFEQAAEADKSNPQIIYALGEYLLQKGQIEEAKNRFMAAHVILPEKGEYIIGYAKALIAQDQFAESRSWLEKALAYEPQNADLQYQMGRVLVHLKDPLNAITHFRRSQEYKANNFEATVALAELFNADGRIDLAITEYKNAVVMSPNNKPIHLALGHLLIKKSRYDAAVQELNRSIELTTDMKEKANIFLELGGIYLLQKDYRNAIDTFRKVLRYKPDSIDGAISLGKALFLKGSYAEAQEALQQIKDAKMSQEQAAELNFNLANSYLASSDFENAMAYYEKVLAVRPNDPLVQFQLGNLALRQNLYRKALEKYDLAWKKLQNPDDKYDALLGVAQSYYKLEEITNAQKIYIYAIKLFPNKQEAYMRLGQLFDEQQMTFEAQQYYLRAAEVNPKDDRPHYFLGFAYKATNQPAKALNHFQIALKLNPQSKNAEEIRQELEQLQRVH